MNIACISYLKCFKYYLELIFPVLKCLLKDIENLYPCINTFVQCLQNLLNFLKETIGIEFIFYVCIVSFLYDEQFIKFYFYFIQCYSFIILDHQNIFTKVVTHVLSRFFAVYPVSKFFLILPTLSATRLLHLHLLHDTSINYLKILYSRGTFQVYFQCNNYGYHIFFCYPSIVSIALEKFNYQSLFLVENNVIENFFIYSIYLMLFI